MCRFSHFSKTNREKTNKFLTLAFVISILIHGLAQIATSVWLLVSSYSACAFLQKYYAPVYTHVTSGVSALLVASCSIIGTQFYHYNCHVRYFIIGIGIIVSLEFSSILSAVVLDNLTKTQLPTAMKDSFIMSMKAENESSPKEHVNCWTGMHEQYLCCGVVDFMDWDTNSKNTTTNILHNDVLDSCKCTATKNGKHKKCVKFNNETIYGTSCLNSVSEKFAASFRLVIATDASFCIMQCLSYIVLNYMLSRLNSKCSVNVYTINPKESETKL